MSNNNSKPDRGFAFLKFVVHSMGVVLIAGIILLFYLAYQRNKTGDHVEIPDSVINENILPQEAPACSAKPFSLPVKGTIDSVAFHGDLLAIVLKTTGNWEKQQKIVLMDYCTHDIISVIHVQP